MGIQLPGKRIEQYYALQIHAKTRRKLSYNCDGNFLHTNKQIHTHAHTHLHAHTHAHSNTIKHTYTYTTTQTYTRTKILTRRNISEKQLVLNN